MVIKLIREHKFTAKIGLKDFSKNWGHVFL